MACCEWSEGYTEGAKEVCPSCEDREFRLLYDSCPDGRCRGQRDCSKHKSMWDRPEGWPTSYPKPENTGNTAKIGAYHRGTDADVAQRKGEKAKQEAAAGETPEATKKRWTGYSDRLDALMGVQKTTKGRRKKETDAEREERLDAACDAMARRIEARRVEEWGDIDCAVGEPISGLMGLTVSETPL